MTAAIFHCTKARFGFDRYIQSGEDDRRIIIGLIIHSTPARAPIDNISFKQHAIVHIKRRRRLIGDSRYPNNDEMKPSTR